MTEEEKETDAAKEPEIEAATTTATQTATTTATTMAAMKASTTTLLAFTSIQNSISIHFNFIFHIYKFQFYLIHFLFINTSLLLKRKIPVHDDHSSHFHSHECCHHQ